MFELFNGLASLLHVATSMQCYFIERGCYGNCENDTDVRF